MVSQGSSRPIQACVRGAFSQNGLRHPFNKIKRAINTSFAGRFLDHSIFSNAAASLPQGVSAPRMLPRCGVQWPPRREGERRDRVDTPHGPSAYFHPLAIRSEWYLLKAVVEGAGVRNRRLDSSDEKGELCGLARHRLRHCLVVVADDRIVADGCGPQKRLEGTMLDRALSNFLRPKAP